MCIHECVHPQPHAFLALDVLEPRIVAMILEMCFLSRLATRVPSTLDKLLHLVEAEILFAEQLEFNVWWRERLRVTDSFGSPHSTLKIGRENMGNLHVCKMLCKTIGLKDAVVRKGRVCNAGAENC